MPYQQDWPLPEHGAYTSPGYSQAPAQAQGSQASHPPQRHPMVVVPQQSRPGVQQPPHLYPTPAHPSHQAPQYQTPPAQQHESVTQTLHRQQYYERSNPVQAPYDPGYGHLQPPSLYPSNQRYGQVYPQQQPHRPQHRSTAAQASSQHQQPSTGRTPGPTSSVQVSETPHSRPATQVTPQQRTVAHVQIPVHRPSVVSMDSPMPRSATKRRRSNDGNAIPVCPVPVPSSSPLTELASSQIPPLPTPKPNVDYQAVLLQLSDEYVGAAYSMSSELAAADPTKEQLDQYQSLMAMGMGCLDSVLHNYRQLDRRREARIRLRLASLLHEETDDVMKAEEILSKGIALCERNKLTDLKYAMHHLLARISFTSSPKAAFKAVEKLVAETEALSLVHWTYAFRFLYVALCLRMGGTDTSTLLKHLNAISDTAEDRRHVAVQIVAAALEAMVHLQSGLSEAVELAQRALAAARTHQLGREMQQMPQMRALLDCLDLACGMLHFDPEQVGAKLQQMHSTLDTTSKTGGWSKDGSFALSLGFSSDDDIESETGGIFRKIEDREVALAFQWLCVSQVYEIGFLLSGSAMMHKNSENGKATSYLVEGIKMTKKHSTNGNYSLAAAAAWADGQTSLDIHAQLQLAFAHCGSSDWSAASEVLRGLQQNYTEPQLAANATVAALIVYLQAMCTHAVGDLDAALRLYSPLRLAFHAGAKHTTALRDIQALAILNSIVILRADNHDEPQSKASEHLTAVEPYCTTHHDKALAAAWYTLKATSEPNMPIIKVKQHLQCAVKSGRPTLNQRLLCVIMNLMTHMFFRSIVGGQAEASARTGRSLALKSKDKLWLAVADTMYADTSELCGKNDVARAARHEAEEAMTTVPEGIRKRFEGVVG